MSLPISIIIIAKNEQFRIKECIESVHGWANEIIVVDDASTDQTREIAAQYTKKIYQRVMDLEGRQRNFGVAQAANDWVMMLDCDERPTPALKKEIEELFSHLPDKKVAFWIPQICYVGDVHIKYGGWSNPHLRLYHKNHVRWSEGEFDVVHPGIKIDTGYTGGNLTYALIHYNYRNIEDIFGKVNRMSTLEALKWHLDGRKMSKGKAMWRTVDRFFRRYIGKKGYKDGYLGFILSVSSSLYEFLAYSKYREIKDKGYYLNYLKKRS
ncbi:MAG: glycosyltransferase family 2 protein [Candidatus Omnitrophica bacterium]|nr:glycosyltransferase family 2 protein [Candidatus Omnitrophota bacterium]